MVQRTGYHNSAQGLTVHMFEIESFDRFASFSVTLTVSIPNSTSQFFCQVKSHPMYPIAPYMYVGCISNKKVSKGDVQKEN